jgi:hypothetical protein
MKLPWSASVMGGFAFGAGPATAAAMPSVVASMVTTINLFCVLCFISSSLIARAGNGGFNVSQVPNVIFQKNAFCQNPAIPVSASATLAFWKPVRESAPPAGSLGGQ